jgi:hypothetical protein
MTRNEQIHQERLLKSLQKCHIHLKRLHYAKSEVEVIFPLTLSVYEHLSDPAIGNIDQLIYRFTKLQDELGNNTFRLLLQFLREDVEDKPFRDILNILERLQILDSADTWISLREIRNDLAHDYPMLVEETIDKLNYLYTLLPVLEYILISLERYAK